MIASLYADLRSIKYEIALLIAYIHLRLSIYDFPAASNQERNFVLTWLDQLH